MTTHKVALLAGDGIGPEIMDEAIKVLHLIEERNEIQFELTPALFGAAAYFETGKSFPEETIAACDAADAILKGTIGLSHEESKKIPPDEGPERGALLPMRTRYDTYANFRPVYLPHRLAHFSPLRPEVIGQGIDLMIIRELVGGLYFGTKTEGIDDAGRRYVHEMLEYNEEQIQRVLKVAFDLARKRKKVLHNIHKDNVLKSSLLWNTVLDEVGVDYPEFNVKHVLVDAAATNLCLNPTQFDVMVMENMFGDILSDQCGGILGSLGLMPSACVGPPKSYYEPSHGSAPDIAGEGKANPISSILSFSMALKYSLELDKEANIVEQAVQNVLNEGLRTKDILSKGMKEVST